MIDPFIQNEINKRFYVDGGMGGEITLTSNSSIGSGAFAFVLAGLLDHFSPVACNKCIIFTFV